jgi:hypothetical protein
MLKTSAAGNGVWWKKAIFTSGRSAQVAGHKPEVVVMHPDRRALGRLGRGGLGEAPVHLAEVRPVDGVVVVAFLEAVQDRPEGFLRGDVVELAHLFGRQRQARDRIAP